MTESRRQAASRRKRFFYVALFLAAVGCISPALAQTERDRSRDERADRIRAFTKDVGSSATPAPTRLGSKFSILEAPLSVTAEKDSYAPVFKVSAGLGYALTNNATYSYRDVSDSYLFASAGFSVEKKLAEGLSASIELSASTERYDTLTDLNTDYFSPTFTIAKSIGKWSIGFSYNPTLSFATNYGSITETEHAISAGAEREFKPMSYVTITPGLSLIRFFTDPSGSERSRAVLESPVVVSLDDQWRMKISPKLSTTFYDASKAPGGDHRHDYAASLGFSLLYKIHEHLTLSMAMAVSANESNRDTKDYQRWDTAPSAKLDFKF